MNVQWHLNFDTFSKTYDVSTVSITVGSRSTIVISGRDSRALTHNHGKSNGARNL